METRIDSQSIVWKVDSQKPAFFRSGNRSARIGLLSFCVLPKEERIFCIKVFKAFFLHLLTLGCIPKGSCNNTLLRRVRIAREPIALFFFDVNRAIQESLNGGLANGGFRYLSRIVHDCLRLSSFCDESSP